MSEGIATLLPEAPTAAPPRVPVARRPVAAGRGPRMRRGSRLGVAVAALALGALYLTPLWHIGLTAPQYPEGLGMYIWVSRITGEKPQDLNSINGLNHYIGMKSIVPESIPELRLLPVVVAAGVALGLLVALIGRRSVLYAWTAVFAAASAAGLADFWRWGYDYGHNLDPHAAIKIPGMTYQPPLLGDKQLLNFHATSWPAMGGWIAILALAVLVALSVAEWRSARARAG
jgi:copper chaperone NosL